MNKELKIILNEFNKPDNENMRKILLGLLIFGLFIYINKGDSES